MEQEVATNPVADAVDTAPAQEVANEADESENLDTEGVPQDDDSEDFEHEGQKYRLPKALKPLLMMQADYTRKTQEVAEQRKALEGERTSLTQQAEQQREHIKDIARLVSMDEQIDQYSKVNWQQLWGEDPQRAGALTSQFQALQHARAQLAGQLTQKEQQRAFEAQQTTAKRLEEAQASLKRDIPEWSPELASKLRDFAVSKGGMKPEEVAGITDPRHVKLLHLAYVGSQLIDKQRQAAKPPQPAANPVPQVSSRSAPARKDPDKMSMGEWMKWQDEEEARRRRR